MNRAYDTILAARLIARVLEFCRDEGVTPVAEGVETADELRRDIGLHYQKAELLGA